MSPAGILDRRNVKSGSVGRQVAARNTTVGSGPGCGDHDIQGGSRHRVHSPPRSRRTVGDVFDPSSDFADRGSGATEHKLSNSPWSGEDLMSPQPRGKAGGLGNDEGLTASDTASPHGSTFESALRSKLGTRGQTVRSIPGTIAGVDSHSEGGSRLTITLPRATGRGRCVGVRKGVAAFKVGLPE